MVARHRVLYHVEDVHLQMVLSLLKTLVIYRVHAVDITIVLDTVNVKTWGQWV